MRLDRDDEPTQEEVDRAVAAANAASITMKLVPGTDYCYDLAWIDGTVFEWNLCLPEAHSVCSSILLSQQAQASAHEAIENARRRQA